MLPYKVRETLAPIFGCHAELRKFKAVTTMSVLERKLICRLQVGVVLPVADGGSAQIVEEWHCYGPISAPRSLAKSHLAARYVWPLADQCLAASYLVAASCRTQGGKQGDDKQELLLLKVLTGE